MHSISFSFMYSIMLFSTCLEPAPVLVKAQPQLRYYLYLYCDLYGRGNTSMVTGGWGVSLSSGLQVGWGRTLDYIRCQLGAQDQRSEALVKKYGKSLKTTPIHFLELHCLSGMNMVSIIHSLSFSWPATLILTMIVTFPSNRALWPWTMWGRA